MKRNFFLSFCSETQERMMRDAEERASLHRIHNREEKMG